MPVPTVAFTEGKVDLLDSDGSRVGKKKASHVIACFVRSQGERRDWPDGLRRWLGADGLDGLDGLGSNDHMLEVERAMNMMR